MLEMLVGHHTEVQAEAWRGCFDQGEELLRGPLQEYFVLLGLPWSPLVYRSTVPCS